MYCLRRVRDDPLHSFTKTGWCLCLRGIVARLLQLTCLARRGQEASRPGVSVLAEQTSRDPGRRDEEVVSGSARCCRSSYGQQWWYWWRGGQRGGLLQVYVRCRGVAGPAGVSGAVVKRGAVSMQGQGAVLAQAVGVGMRVVPEPQRSHALEPRVGQSALEEHNGRCLARRGPFDHGG